MYSQRLRSWLQQANGTQFSIFAIIAAFSTYFCMYAFRKPFSAGIYGDIDPVFGIDYKIVLIITQVIGYTLSKFIGIKVVAEVKPAQRVMGIILLIGCAEIALLLFGVVPAPYNFIFLFFNGLPLGMIWGLVFSFLEGRRFTEALAVGLASSFIVSSGVVKAVGLHTMNSWGVPELWMPFVTGLIFFLPLLFFVWMLGHLPPPTEEDIKMRTERVPMNREDRIRYFKTFAVGLSLLVVVHMLLTAYRDFRDNFAINILSSLEYVDSATGELTNYGARAENLAISEVPIAFTVLVALGFLMAIRNNRTAFNVVHLVVFIGVSLAGLSTVGFQLGLIDPYVWFILVGLGLYLGYVPFQCILFERMIALFKEKANAGFLIYIADATGYLGSVLVLLYKNFGAANLSWLEFFVQASYVLSIVGCGLMLLSFFYFQRKSRSLEHKVNVSLETT